MKQLLALMLLACSTATLAQTEAKRIYGRYLSLKAVPQAFTLEGNAIFYLIFDDGKSSGTQSSFTILDENLQEVNTFGYNHYIKYKVVTERRKDYTGDWETSIDEYEELIGIGEIELCDWRTTYADNQGFYLSQNLFNDDAALEYIVPFYDSNKAISTEADFNGDGIVDYKQTRYGADIVGFSIVSENGSILKSIQFGDGITGDNYFEPAIYLTGNKCYLSFDCRDETGSFTLFYSIDRNTSAIQQVAKHKGPSVSPRIADRSENISVSLEEAEAREVQVVDAAGKTVLRLPVKPGQQEVNIPAHFLSRGVNIINVIGSSKNPTKVIVK